MKNTILKNITILATMTYAFGTFSASMPTQASVGTMYKDVNCGCCSAYLDILTKNGIKVDVVNVDDIYAIKEKVGVPEDISACHTITLNGHIVEGHVPINLVKQVIKGEHRLYGVAVAGMPMHSPGMGGADFGENVQVYVFEKAGRFKKYGKY